MIWDGKERRFMSQDQINRDRLLERLDTNVEYLVKGQQNTTQALMDHAKVDDVRFGKIDTTLQNMNNKNTWFYGAVYGGSAVVGAVAGILIKFIFH